MRRRDLSLHDQTHTTKRLKPMGLLHPVVTEVAAGKLFDEFVAREHYSRGPGASTSRLPTWFAWLTTPSFSICSISLAARL